MTMDFDSVSRFRRLLRQEIVWRSANWAVVSMSVQRRIRES